MDRIIYNENLKDVFVYVDNLTVCGMTQTDHDLNLKKFYDAAAKYGLTFNHSKSI